MLTRLGQEIRADEAHTRATRQLGEPIWSMLDLRVVRAEVVGNR